MGRLTSISSPQHILNETVLEQHLASRAAVLEGVTACLPSCPKWWEVREDAWRQSSLKAERSRMLTHANEHQQENIVWSKRILNSRSKLALAYWQPEYNCGAAKMRFPADQKDGAKWMCGPPLAPQRCLVLSLGSNFDDSFEHAMALAYNCTSYVVDPTLQPTKRVQAFSSRLAHYGSHLNASIGIGSDKSGRDRRHSRIPFDQLLRGVPWCSRGHCHIAVRSHLSQTHLAHLYSSHHEV